MPYPWTALFAVAALGTACAYRGVPSGAPESEVRRVMGAPALELVSPDGTRRLAYPTGPLGLHTYMAYIGPDGRLVRIEQVLDDERIQAIRPGMTTEELLRLIGPPSETVRFDNLRQTAWDYRYRDTWGYVARLSVMVGDDDRVASRITDRLERERRPLF